MLEKSERSWKVFFEVGKIRWNWKVSLQLQSSGWSWKIVIPTSARSIQLQLELSNFGPNFPSSVFPILFRALQFLVFFFRLLFQLHVSRFCIYWYCILNLKTEHFRVNFVHSMIFWLNLWYFRIGNAYPRSSTCNYTFEIFSKSSCQIFHSVSGALDWIFSRYWSVLL